MSTKGLLRKLKGVDLRVLPLIHTDTGIEQVDSWISAGSKLF